MSSVTDKAWYQRNKAKCLKQMLDWHKQRRSGNRARIIEYLAAHPCVDCGESDPVVLEFDHREGKAIGVSQAAYQRSWPWEKVAAEMAKCDVRCANCHRRKTASQREYHKG